MLILYGEIQMKCSFPKCVYGEILLKIHKTIMGIIKYLE